MTLPRPSIAGVMVAVAIIAVNLAILGNIVNGDDNRAILESSGTIVMANLLVVATRRAIARPRARRFLVGFLGAGLAAMVGYLICCRLYTDAMVDSIAAIIESILSVGLRHLPGTFMNDFNDGIGYARVLTYLILVPVLTALLALPQLFVALLGGFLAHRIGGRAKVSTA